jgi:VWFA-related protein
MIKLSGMCGRDFAVMTILGLISAMRLLSQAPLPTGEISVSTHLVQMSVIVRDGKGLVKGLTRNDFSVVDQGKARQISVFTAEPAEAVQSAGPMLAQNVFSDRTGTGSAGEGNVTIILLDSLNTLLGSGPMPFEDQPRWMEAHAMASAKQHLLATIRELDPRERIAVYGLGPTAPSLRTLCDFTCSREEQLAAVKRYDPSSMTLRDIGQPGDIRLPGGLEGADHLAEFSHGINGSNTLMASEANQRRGELTMFALDAIAKHVDSIPGRKNLLWLTANLPYSGEAIAGILAPAKIVAYPVDARGLLVNAGAIEPATRINPMGGPSGRAAGIDAMVEMAEDTGGHAYVNGNDISGAIREVLEEPVSAYTIGFYVNESSVDGKFHAVKIKVDRPDLTIQYPKGYFAVKERQMLGDHGRSALLATLRSPFGAAGIPLDVTVARVEEPKPHMLQVTGSVGIRDVSMLQKGDVRTANLDVYTVEQDAAGKVLRETTIILNLRLTADQYLEYLQSGVKFHDEVQPAKGTSVVRVLVRDPSTQKIGSVVIPLAHVK